MLVVRCLMVLLIMCSSCLGYCSVFWESVILRIMSLEINFVAAGRKIGQVS